MAGNIVVPLINDKISLDDGLTFKVIGVNRHKPTPSVFIDAEDTSEIFFEDIKQINGIMVDYDSRTHTFNAIGMFKSRTHLPQPQDTVVTNDGEFVVDQLKFHNKKIGFSKGLVIISGKDVITLNKVKDIKEKSGLFNEVRFKRAYAEYFPFGSKT